MNEMYFYVIGIIILIIYIIQIYNKFITLKNRVKTQWGQVNVQLKKRNNLIPELVSIVKAYSKFERTTLKEITILRSAGNKSNNINKKYAINERIKNLMSHIFIIAENYPTLKSNGNFLKLQEEITEIEDKIAFSRQFYNDTVFKYNNLLQSFPNSIIGKIFRFKLSNFFDYNEEYKGVNF